MSAEDAARRGAGVVELEVALKCVESSPGLGEDGDEPTDELSVTEVPRERGDIDEPSESLSEFRDEDDEIDETLRSFWATSTAGAVRVSTLVEESKTGAPILERSKGRIDEDFERRCGMAPVLSTELLLRLEREVKDRTIVMVI
jgi:hypothetical protein